ncbi:MAG: xanthine dehydrogenase family protein molybdopterin-binding subunit, partial [Solirubrobacteraceae bacterium]
MLGQRIRRREDPRFLTGNGQYVDDLKLLGARHATFVRSDWAHAQILGIETADARGLPGVEVFTAADVELGRVGIPFPVPVDERVTRPYLAIDRVRYVGEIVAVVLSDTREQGVDAAELVAVDYEPLTVVTDPREALRDEVLLFEDVGTNVCLHQAPEHPDPDLFADCEVTITGVTASQRLAVSPIEPRASAAQPEPDGTLTVWSSTQTPHQDRAGIAEALRIDPEQVRLIAPDVGGGFGGK